LFSVEVADLTRSVSADQGQRLKGGARRTTLLTLQQALEELHELLLVHIVALTWVCKQRKLWERGKVCEENWWVRKERPVWAGLEAGIFFSKPRLNCGRTKTLRRQQMETSN
jgi:hypothetical protein